jgi:nucleoside-triphosphatase
MDVGLHKLLLEGPPRVGKTTVVRRLIALLQQANLPVGGFTTRELRERGHRVGFLAEDINGGAAVIAHVDWTSGPAVGRYHVDVSAFEEVALPALQRALEQGGVVVLDELVQMELASTAFVNAVHQLFNRDATLVATVHVVAHPVTDALKQRPDVQTVEVTRENRNDLPRRLSESLMRDVARRGLLPQPQPLDPSSPSS